MARRVNTKFLVIFSVIVVGGVGAALLVGGPLKHLIRPDKSKKLIEQGDALMKEADAADTAQAKKDKIEAAVGNYRQAAATDTKNPELYVKWGDALNKLTQFDVYTYIAGARAQWDRALEIDPQYLPALRRLQDSFHQETQITPAPQLFARVEEKATAIHKLDPADLKAHSLMYIAPLNQWLANIETPENKIDTAIAELTTLIEKNPTSPELADMVYFVAGSKVRRGLDAKRGGQERQGNELIASAIQTFQAAVKAQEKSAYLHYRYCELLSYLRREDAERDNVQRYGETAKAELERAKELVTKDDESFVKIYIAAHQLAAQRLDMKKAEQILLDLRLAKPNDQRVRLALAKLWRSDPQRRAEAITLLEQPVVETGFTGVEAKQKLDLEVQSLAELETMYIERYPSLPPAEQPEELKRIDATFDKILAKAHERSFVLKLRGKIELLRGGPDAQVKAIKTFGQAQALYRTENTKNLEDTELTWQLAQAYFYSRQTGEAKKELLKLKEKAPGSLAARLLLAQVLIAEGDIKSARVEVDFLEKQAPELPAVLRLVLAVADPTTEALKIKSDFNKLPEETPAEQMSKAQIAPLSPINNPDEAVRLYRLVLAKDPADFNALQAIRQVLITTGKKDDALAVLKAGQAAKPADERIGLMIKEVEGASPEEMKKAARELLVKTTPDEFEREMKLYHFDLYAVGKAEAFKHLEAAEKIKGDDVRLLDLMFQYYVGEQNWDKVNWYVDKLAAKDADQAGGLIYRYRMAMTRGQVDVATEHARALTTNLKEFARSWVFLGQAMQASGQYESAISNYTVALDKQSENPEAIAGIVSCYFQINRPADAFRYIEMGRKAHPSNTYFRDQWRNYQLNYGKPEALIDPAKTDRDANPKDAARWLALGRAQYAAARKRDDNSAKYLADAKATFTEALKQWPGDRMIWAFLSEIADFGKDVAGGEALLKEMAAKEQFKDSPEPLMMLADHYLRNGKADQAVATMRQAIDRFKDNAEIKRRLAAYYTSVQNYDEALKLLDAASGDKIVRQQIVEIYMLQGSKNRPERFAEAERMLRGLLTATPDDAQLHALLGVVLLNVNREDQALESLNRALALDPRNQAALYSRGQMRLKAKVPQLDDAIKDLVALRDVNPNHVEGRVSLGEAFRQKQQMGEATRELEEALRRAPTRRDIRITLAGLYAGAKPPSWGEAERIVGEAERTEPNESLWKRMLAKMYSARGLHERAALKVREAMVADPKNGEIFRDYLEILETGKLWAQLKAEVNQVLAQDKNMAEKGWWVYVKRGVALAKSDQKQEAMADFLKAMDIVEADKDPNQDVLIAIIDKIKEHMGVEAAIVRATALANAPGPKALRWKVVLAYLHFQAKDNTRAIAMIEEARSKSATMTEGNQLTALNVAGTIYMMSGNYDKARLAYEELVARRPDDLGALNNLAFLMAEHVQPTNIPKAMEYSQRAMDAMNKRMMQDPSVLDTIGWVNVLSGDTTNLDRGIDYLNESIKADPDGGIVEAHYHLGEAFLRKKFPEEAKKSLAKANELIEAKEKKKVPVDENLKQRIAKSLEQVEKALLEPRAGNP